MIKGIDISNWQAGLKLSSLPDLGFVICKLSEGLTFKDPTCADFIKQARKKGMLTGCYHFASNANPQAQATRFATLMKSYEDCLPVLDLEDNSIKDWAAFADSFIREYHKIMGVFPLIYTSASACSRYKSKPYVYENCKLWLAGYPRSAATWNDGIVPYNTSPWKTAALWQFTGSGRLSGYGSNLDLDWCYISKSEWLALTKGASSSDNSSSLKSIDDIAKEVIAGKWGNGAERKKKLEAAGYSYSEVQKRVNALLSVCDTKSLYDIAKEVIAGKWGNGAERKKKLEAAGYSYSEVQKIVNKLMKSS